MDKQQTPRLSTEGEDLVGKVCSCSLGRVALVYDKGDIVFSTGTKITAHKGFAFDGNGLWASNVNKPVVIVADSLKEYAERVAARPSNFMYGKASVLLTAP